MKLEYTFTNFVTSIETHGDLTLTVVGSDGLYQYQLFDRQTQTYLVTSKPYKRASDAERYGRKALIERLTAREAGR